MQTIQLFATHLPTEMSPPISYWDAYQKRINLWSVLNKVSHPIPNQPQLLYPGMKVVIAFKGKSTQGYFAGFTDITTDVPKIVIVDEMRHAPWMDEPPDLESAQKTVWSHKIKTLGGQVFPIIHVPITFYASEPVAVQNPLNTAAMINPAATLGPSADKFHTSLPPASTGLPMPEVKPPAVSEKILNIGGKKAKIVNDEVFIEDWVDVDPKKYRVVDVIHDGAKIKPKEYKIQKLDWVKQEESQENDAD